ncbi:MAG: hypothetical protein JWP97_4530 [Labilithrix sp.]|nr:hypothetical protein [Labilithrix sp.]
MLRRSPLLSVAIASGMLACSSPPPAPRHAPGVGTPATITVTSKAFAEGSLIPVDHTCDGADVMPDLTFSSPPEGTRSLALYVEDRDAPSGVFTHLVMWNLSPEVTAIARDPDLTNAGEGVRVGVNDYGGVRYTGPCPPKGEGHRYRFRIVALDAMLKLEAGASRREVDAATDGHILGEGRLMGRFAH